MPSDELQNVMGVNVQGNHVGFAWYKCKLYSKNTDIDIDIDIDLYRYRYVDRYIAVDVDYEIY
mgnify:CR=1 FL=1